MAEDSTIREPEEIRSACSRKLAEIEVSDHFRAILGCLLNEDWTTPRLVEMVVTPDGPFGPYRVAKPGALIVARASGLRVQPWAVHVRPALRIGCVERLAAAAGEHPDGNGECSGARHPRRCSTRALRGCARILNRHKAKNIDLIRVNPRNPRRK